MDTKIHRCPSHLLGPLCLRSLHPCVQATEDQKYFPSVDVEPVDMES